MSQQRVARLIADHQAAMARQDYPATRATICEELRDLAAGAITEGQAIRILATTGARINDPARQALYRQTIAELRQMQADEHWAGQPLSQESMAAAQEARIEATAQPMWGGPAPARALGLPELAHGCSLVKAWDEINKDFRSCTQCTSTVCFRCWNPQITMRTNCAPDLKAALHG